MALGFQPQIETLGDGSFVLLLPEKRRCLQVNPSVTPSRDSSPYTGEPPIVPASMGLLITSALLGCAAPEPPLCKGKILPGGEKCCRRQQRGGWRWHGVGRDGGIAMLARPCFEFPTGPLFGAGFCFTLGRNYGKIGAEYAAFRINAIRADWMGARREDTG